MKQPATQSRVARVLKLNGTWLQVEVTGVPKPKVKWFFGEEARLLETARVSLETIGDFSCLKVRRAQETGTNKTGIDRFLLVVNRSDANSLCNVWNSAHRLNKRAV